MKLKRPAGTEMAIFRLVMRQVLRGSLIFGAFAAFINALQVVAYVAAYSDPVAKAKFVATLKSSQALGILYGSPDHVDTARGYMIYRCLSFVSLIAAIWGLLFITKVLRGQEEDGRWEQLLSGKTSARRATALAVAAGSVGVAIAYVICAVSIVALGKSHDIAIPTSSALFYAFLLVVMALAFMAAGAFTSQLASTRRRAVLYGLVPLIVFFLLRGVGTVSSTWSWLNTFTPFGWLKHIQPLFDARPVWLLPILAFVAILASVGIYLAGKRDLGEGFIREAETHAPHFALVRGPMRLALRLTGPVLLAWLVSSVAVVSLIAALAKLAESAAGDSQSLTKALHSLSNSGTSPFIAAFLSFGGIVLSTILMVMAANGLGAIRRDESKGYLENFLVGPVGRSNWLGGRLAIIVGASLAISLLGGAAIYIVISLQGIHLDSAEIIFGGLNILGPIALLLGLGTLVYGLRPRLASLVMYVVVAWSFVLDTLSSVVTLNKTLAQTSLLHYIALVPAAKPNWRTFGVLIALAGLLAAVGIYFFSQRDLEAE